MVYCSAIAAIILIIITINHNHHSFKNTKTSPPVFLLVDKVNGIEKHIPIPFENNNKLDQLDQLVNFISKLCAKR